MRCAKCFKEVPSSQLKFVYDDEAKGGIKVCAECSKTYYEKLNSMTETAKVRKNEFQNQPHNYNNNYSNHNNSVDNAEIKEISNKYLSFMYKLCFAFIILEGLYFITSIMDIVVYSKQHGSLYGIYSLMFFYPILTVARVIINICAYKNSYLKKGYAFLLASIAVETVSAFLFGLKYNGLTALIAFVAFLAVGIPSAIYVIKRKSYFYGIRNSEEIISKEESEKTLSYTPHEKQSSEVAKTDAEQFILNQDDISDVGSVSENNKSAVILFCHKCGNKLLPGSAFCNKCGEKIPDIQ